MIDKIEILIKENNLELFKKNIIQTPLNHHQKEVILSKCFIHGAKDFIEFMSSKTNNSSSNLIANFFHCFHQPIKQENLLFFEKVNDSELSKKLDTNKIKIFIQNQNREVFDWFVQYFPITNYIKYKDIVQGSIEFNKIENLRHFQELKIDIATGYGFAMCALKSYHIDSVNDLLLAQFKSNPHFFQEMKDYQKLSLQKIKSTLEYKIANVSPKRETQFIIIEAQLHETLEQHIFKIYSLHLARNLEVKPLDSETKKVKKI